MDIKVNTKPAEDTNELSIADGTFVDGAAPATDLEDLEGKKTTVKAKPPVKKAEPKAGAQKAKEPTPTVIREIVEDAALGNSDEASIPTMMMDVRGNRKRNIIISVAFGAALIVALAVLGRSGGSSSETQADITQVAAGASDDTETVETTAAVEDDDVMDLTDLQEVIETDDLKGVYDAEKCAAPSTDRAWLECNAAAYSDLRSEQKRLTARIAELEARPATTEVKAPTGLYVLTALLLLGVGIHFFIVFRNRKGSGDPAP